jgi:hypothetical protein
MMAVSTVLFCFKVRGRVVQVTRVFADSHNSMFWSFPFSDLIERSHPEIPVEISRIFLLL